MTVATLTEPTYLWVPDYSVTIGDEVADLCAQAGYVPDPEQRLVLDAIFARRGNQSACFEVGVVAPRQNMKTGTFKMAALGFTFIMDQPLVVWSAHEFDTSAEDHRTLSELIQGAPFLDRRIKRIYEGNGNESIVLKGGQRILFKARTKVKGRGLAAPKLVLDEAFALEAAHLGSLMPLMSVQPDPQILYGSSAGHVKSEILRRLRDRGRAGRSDRLFYAEWAAVLDDCQDERCEHEVGTPGCEFDNRERWREANSLLGKTRVDGTGLTYAYVQDERQSMPPHEFGRERLGIWDEPEGTEAAFGKGKWESAAGSDRPDDLKLGALAIAASWDLSWAAIGGAGHADGIMHIKPLAHQPGDTWVVDDVKALQDEHGVKVVIDEKGPAASLIPDLREAGIDLHVATLADVLDAFDGMYKGVRSRVVQHANYPELNAAASSAVPRSVGDRRAWGRKQSESDISTLESVTLAAWWAANHQESSEPLVAWV